MFSNYVRIHVPVIKHTRHHTRTLVKKVPVPVPIPVPVHDHDNDDDHEEPDTRWFDDKKSFSSYKGRYENFHFIAAAKGNG